MFVVLLFMHIFFIMVYVHEQTKVCTSWLSCNIADQYACMQQYEKQKCNFWPETVERPVSTLDLNRVKFCVNYGFN